MTVHTPKRGWKAAAGVAVAVALSTVLAACGVNTDDKVENADHSMSHESVDLSKEVALHNAMSSLWADHMQWTLSVVDAFYHDTASLDAKLARLLQNQQDIGNAIKPYYGDEAGDALAELLTEHIELAVPVLTAAQEDDEAGLEAGLAEWYRNANDIAVFLSTANPDSWPADATEPAMKSHIDHTTAYAVDLLKGDYEAAIKQYDEAFEHMLMLGDTLAEGIIAAFPDKF